MKIAVAFLALLLGLACSREPTACDLPAVSDFHRGTDATLVFTLDSAGIVANGRVVEAAKVGALIRDVFALRPPETRAVFVWQPAANRCSDVRLIASEAAAAGGAAYDAAKSGWPLNVEMPSR